MHKIPSSAPPTAHTSAHTLHTCTKTNQRISALNARICKKLEGKKNSVKNYYFYVVFFLFFFKLQIYFMLKTLKIIKSKRKSSGIVISIGKSRSRNVRS